jgi:hypothetical protein
VVLDIEPVPDIVALPVDRDRLTMQCLQYPKGISFSGKW